MKHQRISELLASAAHGQEVTVKGWVRTKRGNKNVTFIALNDGSCVANIQVVVDPAAFDEELLKKITTGSCLRVDGRLVESLGSGQGVEVQASAIEIYGTADHNPRIGERRGQPQRHGGGLRGASAGEPVRGEPDSCGEGGGSGGEVGGN